MIYAAREYLVACCLTPPYVQGNSAWCFSNRDGTFEDASHWKLKTVDTAANKKWAQHYSTRNSTDILYLEVASNFDSYCVPCFACVRNIFVSSVLRVQTVEQGLSAIAFWNLNHLYRCTRWRREDWQCNHNPFQPLYLPSAKQQRKATFVAAHRYGISFEDLVHILHDAHTSVETCCKTNSVANTLHTTIHVGEADRSVRSVEVNFRWKRNVAEDRWFG